MGGNLREGGGGGGGLLVEKMSISASDVGATEEASELVCDAQRVHGTDPLV
jgi:hypothetical protein